MSIKIKLIVVVILSLTAKTSLNAQRIALTSNLLEDALLTPNIGVDIVVADRQSLTFDTSFSPYRLADRFCNKRMTVRAGYRYWFNQTFYAHYIGVDAVASSSDVQVGRLNSRDEYIGLGIGYGYSYIINKRLNIVPHIGIGFSYGRMYEGYDHMTAPGKGVEATVTKGFKPILTRMGVTIHYVLR